MEAYHIDRFGNVDGIVLRSGEDPRPWPKEVLMRVRASSLNYRDLMVLGRSPTKIGVVPLSDGAGEVAAVGEGVTQVKIGDRIAGCFHPRWFGGPIKIDYLTDRLGANLNGMLAQYAVLNAPGCAGDCDDIDCREGRAAEGAGRVRGDQLHPDARLGHKAAGADR